MMIKRSDWDYQIIFEKKSSNMIVIPDHNLLFRYQRELIAQCNGELGEFTITDLDQQLKMESEIELIPHPYLLSLNSKKTISYLHKKIIKETAILGYPEKIETINREIIKILKDIKADLLINYVFDTDFGLDNFIKWYDVKYEESVNDPGELIIKYLDLVREITKIKLMIFFHAYMFLTQSQLLELDKYLVYHDMTALYLENNKPNLKRDNSNIYIIDQDMCYTVNKQK